MPARSIDCTFDPVSYITGLCVNCSSQPSKLIFMLTCKLISLVMGCLAQFVLT